MQHTSQDTHRPLSAMRAVLPLGRRDGRDQPPSARLREEVSLARTNLARKRPTSAASTIEPLPLSDGSRIGSKLAAAAPARGHRPPQKHAVLEDVTTVNYQLTPRATRTAPAGHTRPALRPVNDSQKSAAAAARQPQPTRAAPSPRLADFALKGEACAGPRAGPPEPELGSALDAAAPHEEALGPRLEAGQERALTEALTQHGCQ